MEWKDEFIITTLNQLFLSLWGFSQGSTFLEIRIFEQLWLIGKNILGEGGEREGIWLLVV